MGDGDNARHFFGGVVGIKLPHHRVWAGNWFDVDVYLKTTVEDFNFAL